MSSKSNTQAMETVKSRIFWIVAKCRCGTDHQPFVQHLEIIGHISVYAAFNRLVYVKKFYADQCQICSQVKSVLPQAIHGEKNNAFGKA